MNKKEVKSIQEIKNMWKDTLVKINFTKEELEYFDKMGDKEFLYLMIKVGEGFAKQDEERRRRNEM